MKFPRKIFINQNAKIFNIVLRLKISEPIFLIIKNGIVRVITSSLLVRVKSRYKVRFFSVKR